MTNSVRKIIHSAQLVIILLLACFAVATTLFAQSGEELYNKKCAVCHAKDGSGNTAKGKKVHVKAVHDNMKDSESAMIKVVTDGKGDDMDAYKSEFTADQIKALVEYYRNLGK